MHTAMNMHAHSNVHFCWRGPSRLLVDFEAYLVILGVGSGPIGACFRNISNCGGSLLVSDRHQSKTSCIGQLITARQVPESLCHSQMYFALSEDESVTCFSVMHLRVPNPFLKERDPSSPQEQFYVENCYWYADCIYRFSRSARSRFREHSCMKPLCIS